MDKSPTNPDGNNYEGVFLNARREALVTMSVWTAGLAWTLCYCWFTGYDIPAEQMKVTFGMPSWIFWGILAPWILIILFTIWFGLFYITDDELGQGQQESEREGLGNSQSARSEVTR